MGIHAISGVMTRIHGGPQLEVTRCAAGRVAWKPCSLSSAPEGLHVPHAEYVCGSSQMGHLRKEWRDPKSGLAIQKIISQIGFFSSDSGLPDSDREIRKIYSHRKEHVFSSI